MTKNEAFLDIVTDFLFFKVEIEVRSGIVL
jgi:hypothetical protein